ncbi:MAG: hypothetical protein Q9225_002940 [Loekoesia sp. 1 TL-2023]
MASLCELAARISTETKKIADFIQENELPDPSFALGGPASLPIPVENAELQASRMALVKAAEDLSILAFGPVESLRWKAWNLSSLIRSFPRDTLVADDRRQQFNDNISLQIILRYRVAEAIPLDQPISFAAVANKTQLPEAQVTRLLRHAMMSHLFCEPIPGHVSHTVSSASLLENTIVRNFLDMTFEECGPASLKAADAFAEYPGSQEPHETGFTLAFAGQTFFNYLSERPERAKVGGGEGHVSIAIAEAAPSLSFVVQDLPHRARDGERLLPPEYKSRIKFQGHDINNTQPVHGASLYLFRGVLHNWPDKYVIKFLRNLIPALVPGARVLVNEGCLPKPGELTAWDERLLRSLDLQMQALFNSKQRSEGEWENLFKAASERFGFLGARRPKQGGLLWIVEAVWKGENKEREVGGY